MASESATVGHGFCCCGLYGTYVERVQPHWWFCPRKEIYFDSNRVTDALYVLRTQGMDSVCGCPRTCPGPTIEVARGPFLPDELHDIINLTDFNKFADKIDEALAETHWPTIPCEFTFCLAVLAFNYCANQRHERIQSVLDEHNQRLAERGLYWEPLNFPGYVAQLKVNHRARQTYLAKHGLAYDRVPTPKNVVIVPNTDDDAKLARQLSEAYNGVSAANTTSATTVILQQPRVPEPTNNRLSTSSYNDGYHSVYNGHSGHNGYRNGYTNGRNGSRERIRDPGHGNSSYYSNSSSNYRYDAPTSRQLYGSSAYHNVSIYEGRVHEYKEDDDVRDSVRGSVRGSVDDSAPVHQLTRASSSQGVTPERICTRYSSGNMDAQGNLLDRSKNYRDTSRYDLVMEQQRVAEAQQSSQFVRQRSGELTNGATANGSGSNGTVTGNSTNGQGTHHEVNVQDVDVTYATKDDQRRSPDNTPEGIQRVLSSGHTTHNNSIEKLSRDSSFNQAHPTAEGV